MKSIRPGGTGGEVTSVVEEHLLDEHDPLELRNHGDERQQRLSQPASSLTLRRWAGGGTIGAPKTPQRVLDMTTEPVVEKGATVVVTHRVRDDKLADYEKWLEEITPVCKTFPGYLDWHIVRPIPGLSTTFTVIVRFDSEAHVRGWIESPVRARLIRKAQGLFVKGDDFFISSGLDFWFAPPGAKAQVPVRWKQAVVTWSAIYPLVLAVTLVVVPVLKRAFPSLGDNGFVTALVVTGIVVFLMVYVVMPRYTRSIRRWLFR